MNKRQQKVLDDEDNFDLAKAAEIIQSEKIKPKKPLPSRQRSLQAWQDKKARDQKKESLRQTLARHWQRKTP